MTDAALNERADPRPLVLLVDDNELNLVVHRDFLQVKGYHVVTAMSGEEAISRMASYPDVVLMDIQMPGIDGLETTRRIRGLSDGRAAQTPILALTALAMPGDAARCLEAGCTAYLSKPIRLAELLGEIERVLMPS